MGKEVSIVALIVGYVDYGDNDRIVSLLSPEHGLISAMAKYARSSKKYAGAIDLGNQVNLTVSKGQGSLWKIHEAQVISGRHRMRRSLKKISLMSYTCEYSALLSQPENPEPKLFGLLNKSLELLEENDGSFGSRFRIGFEAKALAFVGLTPVLGRCLRCTKSLKDEKLTLMPKDGGVIHNSCLNLEESSRNMGYNVDMSWLLAVVDTVRKPLAEAIDSPMPPGPHWALSQIAENMMQKKIKSKSFLQQLGENG